MLKYLDQKVFATCTTPNQASRLVRPYAKQYGWKVDALCQAVSRKYRLFIDAESVRRASGFVPTWSTCVNRVSQGKPSMPRQPRVSAPLTDGDI